MRAIQKGSRGKVWENRQVKSDIEWALGPGGVRRFAADLQHSPNAPIRPRQLPAERAASPGGKVDDCWTSEDGTAGLPTVGQHGGPRSETSASARRSTGLKATSKPPARAAGMPYEPASTVRPTFCRLRDTANSRPITEAGAHSKSLLSLLLFFNLFPETQARLPDNPLSRRRRCGAASATRRASAGWSLGPGRSR